MVWVETLFGIGGRQRNVLPPSHWGNLICETTQKWKGLRKRDVGWGDGEGSG